MEGAHAGDAEARGGQEHLFRVLRAEEIYFDFNYCNAELVREIERHLAADAAKDVTLAWGLPFRFNLPFARRPATMIPMRNVGNETEAIRAIVTIITEQKALEKYQRAKEAAIETLQDSMVYAYDEIIQVLKPFMDDEG